MEKSKSLIKFLLLAVFIKQLVWVSFVPIWQTPDEQAHFAQVQNRAELGNDEQFTPNLSKEIWLSENILGVLRDERGNNRYTYHPEFNINYSANSGGIQENEISSLSISDRTTYIINEATTYPPAYYLFGSWLYKIFYNGSLFDRVFFVRLLSAICLVGLTYIAYLVGRYLYNKPRDAIFLAILVGFFPMLTFVHSGVTSDALFNLLFGTFVLFCLRLINNGLNLKDLIIVSLLMLISFTTKPQANIMAFIIIPLLLVLIFRNKKLSVQNILVTIVLGVVSCLGIAVRLMNGGSFLPESNNVTFTVFSVAEHMQFTLNHTYREVLPWFWGVFRWLSLGLPIWLRQTTNTLTVLSLVGFVVYIFLNRNRTDKKFWGIIFCLFSLVVYFLSITVFDYGFRQTHQFSFGIQGRYFFPVIIPFMVIFMIGLKPLGKLLPIAMIVFCVAVFFWVTGSYYQFSLLQFFTQASQYKPVWLKFPINLVLLGSYLLSTLYLLAKL